MNNDPETLSQFLSSRMGNLGLNDEGQVTLPPMGTHIIVTYCAVCQDQLVSCCQQAFVLVNPPKKLELKPTDLMYVVKLNLFSLLFLRFKASQFHLHPLCSLVLKPLPSSHDDIMPVDIIGQPGSDGANLVWGQNIRTTNV